MIKLLQNRIAQCAACATFIIGLATGIVAYDDRVAKQDQLQAVQEDIELVGQRLEQKIVQDNIDRILERIWKYEAKYGGPGVPNAPPHEKDEYIFLRKQLEREKHKLKGD